MNEKNLLITVKIFFPDEEWDSQVKFHYEPENKRKFYKVDCYSKTKKIIFEYEGPLHYENVWKLKRDEERESYFKKLGFKFYRWPYYCQLTRDIAKFFFNDFYSEDKYLASIKQIYGVNEEKYILAPGLHTSKNTPANFVSRGVDRFFSELDEMPSSLRAQVAESLRRYIRDIDDPYLVIGEEKRFKNLVELPISKDELNIFFHRK